MSDDDPLLDAIREARRPVSVEAYIRAAERNGGHIAFGRGEPTLGEFMDWIQAHRGDVMGEEITTHDAYVLWKDFLAGRDLPASDAMGLDRADRSLRVESLMGWCVLWAVLAVSGWAVVLALVAERQGW